MEVTLVWNRVKRFSLKQLHGVKGFCKIVNCKRSISEGRTGRRNILAVQMLVWFLMASVLLDTQTPPLAQLTSFHPKKWSNNCVTPKCFICNLLGSQVLVSFKWGSMKTAGLLPKGLSNGMILFTATCKQIRASTPCRMANQAPHS